jgi:hypothetical protein
MKILQVLNSGNCFSKGTVPDRRRQIHLEVVLVRRWVIWVLGIWRGRVWGKGGIEGSVYKQPETLVDGSCHS